MRRAWVVAAWIVGTVWCTTLVASGEPVTARVTYVTGASVYLSAGRDDGLQVGDRLSLVRGEQTVAVVEVTELSTHRAVCSIAERTLAPAVGDTADFVPRPPEAAPEPEAVEPRRHRRSAGIRGRVGLRYLATFDRTGELEDYSQPSVDLRLDSASIAGSAWGLSIDARARRTFRNPVDGPGDDVNRTRVYSLAVFRRPGGGRWGFTLGRQNSPVLTSVSVFDGVSADYDRNRWSIGLLGGSQPDPIDHGYATDIREYGAYFQFRGAPASSRRWSISTGFIGSYVEGEVNREFLYVQARYVTRALSAFLTQEIDFNRDWKTEAGEDSVSPTSTFISLRYRVGRVVTLRGGYDNRRNARLYRDLVTPVTVFDDRFRLGLWGGVSLSMRDRYRLGLDFRTNEREDAPRSNMATGTFGVRRIAGGLLDLGFRSSRYTNDRVEGWLYSIRAGLSAGARTHVGLSAGLRDEDDLVGLSGGQDQHWFGFDLQYNLSRRWFLTASFERVDGDLDKLDQVYTTLSYRF